MVTGYRDAKRELERLARARRGNRVAAPTRLEAEPAFRHEVA